MGCEANCWVVSFFVREMMIMMINHLCLAFTFFPGTKGLWLGLKIAAMRHAVPRILSEFSQVVQAKTPVQFCHANREVLVVDVAGGNDCNDYGMAHSGPAEYLVEALAPDLHEIC